VKVRTLFGVLASLLVMVAAPLCCWGQMLPWYPSGDSFFRVGYLLGVQDIIPYDSNIDHGNSPHHNHADHYRQRFYARFPVIDGELELSAWSPFAVRGSFGVSAMRALDSSLRSSHSHDPVDNPSKWGVRTDFSAWEAAGLWHLWNGGGYRFSFLAGFRQEHWENFGNNRGNSVTTASLRDDLWSQIPFLGFQTTMSFPFWRARFEFLGSPFMKRRVVGHWLQDNTYAYYDGTGTDGGFLSFRLWGFGTVWRSLALGIDTRLSYQELYGHFTSTDNHHSDVQTYKVMLRESYATFGLFLSYIF
jgi:hypothetical protein